MSDKLSGCPEILNQFLFYIETVKGLSVRTVDGYFVDLRTFFRFIKLQHGLVEPDCEFDDIPINDVGVELVKSITSTDIFEFLRFVSRERENAAATRARKVSSLRAFFNYLYSKANIISNNPAAGIELPSKRKSLPKYLTFEESLELLRVVSGDFVERDYCIITLFLNCGMRLSELVGININDIHDDTVTVTGKGNKQRLVYLNDACVYALENYMRARNAASFKKKDPAALFLSRNGNRLTGRRVEQIVDECLSKAGLSGRGFSAHKLRHTAATLMYQYGSADMLALKEILGHEHVSTTEIYTHIGDEQLRKAMDASPLSSVKMKKKPPERESSKEDSAE